MHLIALPKQLQTSKTRPTQPPLTDRFTVASSPRSNVPPRPPFFTSVLSSKISEAQELELSERAKDINQITYIAQFRRLQVIIEHLRSASDAAFYSAEPGADPSFFHRAGTGVLRGRART